MVDKFLFSGKRRSLLHVKTRKTIVFPITVFSSSLRPGTKGFTCGKWIIGYNFGIDDGAESKFGKHKELIVLADILHYKYCVNKSRAMSRDHLAKN